MFMYKLLFKLTFIGFTAFAISVLNAGEGRDENSAVKEVPGYLTFSYNLSEKLVLPMDEIDFNRFQLIHKANVPRSGVYVHEWVPKGQDLTNWKEMITISYMRNIISNVSEFDKSMVRQKQKYRGSKCSFEMVYKNQKESVYILEVPNGHKDIPPFTTIMRQVFTLNGLHFVLYEKRNELLSTHEKEKWVENLRKGFLSEDMPNFKANR